MKMSMEYPCVYFEKDGKCRKFSDDTAISYCVMGPCPEQKLSNADRIRSMSDEELAKALYRMQKDLCRYLAKAIGYTDPLEFDEDAPDILNWLQQPAEEDT